MRGRLEGWATLGPTAVDVQKREWVSKGAGVTWSIEFGAELRRRSRGVAVHLE